MTDKINDYLLNYHFLVPPRNSQKLAYTFTLDRP